MHRQRNTLFSFTMKFATMACFVILTYLGLWAMPVRSDVVYASVRDKHLLLENQTPPRIIFVGGSGIALGLDSTLIETEMQRPVINMGVNAGFGLHYMLDEVRPYLQSGDLVIVVPEYEHFYGMLFEGDENLLWALRMRPQALRYTTWKQLALLVPDIPSFMQSRIRELTHRLPDPIYNRWAFDAHGDFINHLALPSDELELHSIQGKYQFNQTTIGRLTDFVDDANQKGATVYLLYPAIAESFWHYGNNQQVIDEIQAQIGRAPQLETFSSPEDYVLPDRYFFDTVYHLSAGGRQVRSQQIVQDLREITGTVSHVPTRAKYDANLGD